MLRYLFYIFCLTIIITLQTFAQSTWVPFLQPTYTKPATILTTSNNSNVSFNVQINGMQTSDQKIGVTGYQSLSIPDGELMIKEGSPQIPMMTKLIAIPDCDNVSISVSPSNQLQFANYNVPPAPRYEKKKLPDGTDQRILVFEEDKSVYSANSDFPGKYGEIIETGYVRGQKVARVAIYPIQFSPASKSIKVYTNFNISLSFVNSTSPVNKELGIFRGMMHHIALNYEPSGINATTKISNTIKNNQLSKASPERITSGSVIRVTDLSTLKGTNAIPVDYLIITHSSLYNSNSLTILANHRRDFNGYDVAIVLLDSIYADYPRTPSPANNYISIRDFIDSVFNKGKANHTGDGHLGYICLVGDAKDDNGNVMLPAAYPPSNVSPYYSSLEQGGDYYYACTGGDSDDLQDVMYGRISIGNETELSNVVNKIISYESNSNGSWNNNCMFISSHPWALQHWGSDAAMKQMIETIPASYQKYYAYRAYNGYNSVVNSSEASIFGQSFATTTYDISDSLCGAPLLNDWLLNHLNASNGIHTLVFEDHGEWNTLNSDEGCGRDIFYLHKDNDCPSNTNCIDSRLNNSLYPFMIFNCCKTGDFDEYGNCLAEVLVNLANRGAIGVLASTRDSDPNSFGCVDQYILEAQYNNLSHIMGEAVMESKLLLSSSEFRRQYNLYGDPAVNLWPMGYTVSQNMTLSGTNLISENITVASGVTLTISAGATLRFANGCSLIVNGVLHSVGTSSNPITFTPTSGTSAGSWGIITFSGSTASSSNLNYVNISYGAGIQCLNGANVTIQNSNIETCSNGIYIYNSQPSIINNIIDDPQQNGIYGEAAGLSPWIKGNTITRTTNLHNYQGILLGNSTCPDILNNYITGFYWGMYLGGGCQSSTGGSEFWVCNNHITDNRYGIGTGWGSYTNVGEDDGTGAFNSICNNLVYNLCTYEYSYLTCFHNWLGGDTKIYTDATSYSDWDPGFTYDLCSAPYNSKNDNNLIATTLKKSGKPIFFEGVLLEKEGKIDEAIDFYKNLIKDDDHANIVLSRLLLLKNKYSKPDITNYFESLLTSNTKYYGKVKNLIGDIYLQNNRLDDAIVFYTDVIKKSQMDYDGINARFEKLFAYLHIKNDLTTASQILSEIKGINSKEEEVQMRIEIAENLINGSNNVINKSANLAGENIPTTYELYQNYPNPFNPATTIKYQIPKPGLVTLKVYDILGREVATLVSENKIEETYDITFDASRFTSGVYIYQIRVNDYVSSKKMILLK